MKLLLIILSVLMLSLLPAQPNVTSADIVFKNGNVYTANDRAPKAQAIAVRADRIVYVGTNADAQKYVGQSTRVVDLHGNTAVHEMQYGCLAVSRAGKSSRGCQSGARRIVALS